MKRLITALLIILATLVPASAATRIAVPGGTFGDNLPSGEYAVGRNGQPLLTHQGEIPAPEPVLLFNRITNVGGFKIASKAGNAFAIYIYENGAWRTDGRDSHGVQGHAWGPDGQLYVIRELGDQESMGLRFYDPVAASIPGANLDITGDTAGFVTGSPSYTSSTPLAQALGITRLFEWTKCGDVAVGQGDIGGTAVLYQGKHYLLEPGDSRFVQFKCAGSALAVAITRLVERDVVLHWLQKSEIASLPAYPASQPEPKPDPRPDPEPEPEPQTVSAPHAMVEYFALRWQQLGVRERGRAMADSGASSHEIAAMQSDALFQIAGEWHHVKGGSTLGLYPKTSGTNHKGFGEDILLFRIDGKVFWKDVVVSISTPDASLNVAGEYTLSGEPDKWVAPPVPGVVDQPKPDESAALKAHIKKLEEQIAVLRIELDALRGALAQMQDERDQARGEADQLRAERDGIQQKLDAILALPEPRCTASIFGIKVPCKVIR
jgi:FtsZ-binding cell division protein ZapB